MSDRFQQQGGKRYQSVHGTALPIYEQFGLDNKGVSAKELCEMWAALGHNGREEYIKSKEHTHSLPDPIVQYQMDNPDVPMKDLFDMWTALGYFGKIAYLKSKNYHKSHWS